MYVGDRYIYIYLYIYVWPRDPFLFSQITIRSHKKALSVKGKGFCCILGGCHPECLAGAKIFAWYGGEPNGFVLWTHFTCKGGVSVLEQWVARGCRKKISARGGPNSSVIIRMFLWLELYQELCWSESITLVCGRHLSLISHTERCSKTPWQLIWCCDVTHGEAVAKNLNQITRNNLWLWLKQDFTLKSNKQLKLLQDVWPDSFFKYVTSKCEIMKSVQPGK